MDEAPQKQDREEWHRLFNAALSGTLDEADQPRLEAVLRGSREARELWYLYGDVECGLAELKASPTQAAAAAPRRWLRWSPLTAAAAGLVFGLLSASMVWGYAGAGTSAGRTFGLLAESFESGPAPLIAGMPVTPGHWGGDYSEVSAGHEGRKPLRGEKCLRLLRASYEGKPVKDGYVADLFRIIDLRDLAPGGAEETVLLAIEAHFAALPQDGLTELSCGVKLHALDSLPADGTRDDVFLRRAGEVETREPDAGPNILATSARNALVPADGHGWHALRSELSLPSDARYCLIHLHAHLRGSWSPETPKPVEFAGVFLDDIRLTLTRQATPHPVSLSLP